jgi:hypothetical protein
VNAMTFEKLIAWYGPTIAYLGDKPVESNITIAEFAAELAEGGAVFAASPVMAELGEAMQAAAVYLADAASLPDGDLGLPRLLDRAALHLDAVKVLA